MLGIGDTLGGRFELVRLAETGGMGEIYEARERATGERLAVKVLRTGREEAAERFERETQILSTSSHPHIVRYVARGALPTGEPWLVMEWLEGEDLASRLRRGPLGVAEGVRLLRAAAGALGAMHARGVVHRDVKPSNLFLVGGCIEGLKVLDFGIAQLPGASRLTDTGLILGTPGYMAPEQARDRETVDARADVFSLGAVLFECLTGRPAFRGGTFLAVMSKTLFEEPPRLRDLVPRAPEGLDELVARMLSKHAEDRPADGRAVAAALSNAWITDDVPAPERPRSAITRSERRMIVRRQIAEGPRLLLGKPTPCVGRERDLDMVTRIFDECVEDGVAHAVLVVAPPGMGKSRLAHELLRVLRARGEPLSIWNARADPLRQSSALGLLGQALRVACGLREGQPLEAARDALLTRITTRMGLAGQPVAEMLGEIVGVPFPDTETPRLREARKNAQLLADRIQDAWLSFLQAECSVAPVLLLLDDLQWSDRPTAQLVDAALRECRGSPLLVLALGRPEVHDVFPNLWSKRRFYELRLRKLGLKASEELVRHVLGEAASEETASRICALSDGNAFYLEELIRAAGEDRTTLPETVVSMVQSRLAQLDGTARRMLRAASIFGETFWAGGVVSLMGESHHASEVQSAFARLMDGELVVRVRESRFPGEEEFRFRHALLREGAYSMLLGEDRALGHLLAGQWLERHGEEDPSVLAEHFERGGDLERACHYHARAAERSFAHFDLDSVLVHVERGVSCGAAGEVLLTLRSWQLMAHDFRGSFTEEVLRLAEEARATARPGSAAWYRVTHVLCSHCMFTGRREYAITLAREVAATTADTSARAAVMELLVVVVGGLVVAGEGSIAREMLDYLRRVEDRLEETDLLERCHAWQTRAWYLMARDHDPWTSFVLFRKAAAGFTEVGDLRQKVFVENGATAMLFWMGQREASIEHARKALALAQRVRDPLVLGFAQSALQWALLEDARHVEEQNRLSRESVHVYPRPSLFSAFAHVCLSSTALHEGDLASAEAEARMARDGMATTPSYRLLASSYLITALLRQGRAAEAREMAEQDLGRIEGPGSMGVGESRFRLAVVEARWATGDTTAAREACVEARDVLIATAARIEDPAFRRSFLEDVPAHRRTLALAEEMGLGGTH
ncbi:serine/threonine-protein kinase [Polyangium jinanense]|uniref:Protein kinase n=1 Tax=Polyangium jinanense TaxID=2829994 RepID=A0A9X4AR17_9BACT|nr:serine/threonine-protein kinase [Polyangium jinanense]MDC3953253.1 protein kinase [Polyangium jinanense]MDC3979627.1 protein kinase [Polyangium jinanense]